MILEHCQQKSFFHNRHPHYSWLIFSAEDPVFLNLPWETEGLKNVIVRRGQNVFWMKNPLPTDIRINGNFVDVKVEQNLSHGRFNGLLQHKMPFIVDNMKILKDSIKNM